MIPWQFRAEMAHQAAVAEKNRQRAQAAAGREQARRQREAERLQRGLERVRRRESAIEARQSRLAADRARYDEECAQRQREVETSNADLDALIRDLERGTPEAVEEYLGIVFGNSVYPAEWPWPPAYTYDADTQELSIQLQFPVPSDLPTVRAYKYVRTEDQITTATQTQKEQKDRYAALVNNMTLRTLHEVWEADRGHKVTSISLVGSVAHIAPATGKDTITALVAVAVDRATFEDIDLRRVAPVETLRHLGAVVSKNPHALTPIKLAPGIQAH
ncbi:hypothetical protein [Actinokineospora cianjurensis]|nr:hypothetical protein [Actinokineospora cianjurensis]